MSDEALIHMRIPAALKARWVRQSRAVGMKLTDWIVSRVVLQMTTADIIAEVGNIAEQLTDTPIYYRSRQSAEGIEAMIQASRAFAHAKNRPEQLDAALWVGEAYLLFSRSLPDTGLGERSTSWASANQIAKLIGGPAVWEERVRQEFKA